MEQKTFPRFSEAKIQFELSQPQMKLLIASIGFLSNLSLSNVQMDGKKHSQSASGTFKGDNYNWAGISFVDEHLKDPQKLSQVLVQILEGTLQDPYIDKNAEYTDMVIDELNEFYAENFDPEILGLEDGEIFQLAYQGSVTNGGSHG
jgi:hypothetical protein